MIFGSSGVVDSIIARLRLHKVQIVIDWNGATNSHDDLDPDTLGTYAQAYIPDGMGQSDEHLGALTKPEVIVLIERACKLLPGTRPAVTRDTLEQRVGLSVRDAMWTDYMRRNTYSGIP